MKVLCYVHTELPWEHYMTDDFHFQVARAFFTQKWDRVYAFVSGLGSGQGMAQDLIPFVNHLYNANLCEWVDWTWNEEPNDPGEPGYIEVHPSFHDDDYPYMTKIPDEIMGWDETIEAGLVGGGEFACLEEFSLILDHLGVKHHTIAAY